MANLLAPVLLALLSQVEYQSAVTCGTYKLLELSNLKQLPVTAGNKVDDSWVGSKL